MFLFIKKSANILSSWRNTGIEERHINFVKIFLPRIIIFDSPLTTSYFLPEKVHIQSGQSISQKVLLNLCIHL